MKTKINYHKAKKHTLTLVNQLIDDYPKKYSTPKWLLFTKQMIEDGWKVRIYQARVSKYIFITKADFIFKIRFSNHKPIYQKEMENDCDFYVGVSHTNVYTTDQIIEKIKHLVGNL
jgi:hypothetical protein